MRLLLLRHVHTQKQLIYFISEKEQKQLIHHHCACVCIGHSQSMSVITELFENYDHIPLEFRRQLLMMRELDELSNSKQCFQVMKLPI